MKSSQLDSVLECGAGGAQEEEAGQRNRRTRAFCFVRARVRLCAAGRGQRTHTLRILFVLFCPRRHAFFAFFSRDDFWLQQCLLCTPLSSSETATTLSTLRDFLPPPCAAAAAPSPLHAARGCATFSSWRCSTNGRNLPCLTRRGVLGCACKRAASKSSSMREKNKTRSH